MSEVLSQDEIDNLLKALSSGELDVDDYKESKEQQVKNYDFARPAKFSKEHLRTLEIIFEKFPLYAYWAIIGLIVASPFAIVLLSDFGTITVLRVLVGIVALAAGTLVAYKLGE